MIAPREHAMTPSEIFREFVAACLRAMRGEESGIDWAARDGRRCDWCEDTRACEPARAGRGHLWLCDRCAGLVGARKEA